MKIVKQLRAERKTNDTRNIGRDPFNQNSNRSDREKRTTSKGGPVFSKLFRLDRTDPLSFGPKFPEGLVEWIAPIDWRRLLQSSGAFQVKITIHARNKFYVIKILKETRTG